jgi:pimeloyl-ACP methyl ester carboxylesterase
VGWALETDAETLILTMLADAAAPITRRDQLKLAGRVRCPVLVIHGTDDRTTPPFTDRRCDDRASAAHPGAKPSGS